MRSPPTFMRDLPLAQAAFAFAYQAHMGQRRDADDAPFIIHPLEVGALLRHRGAPEEVVTAGILHDLIEDTQIELPAVEARFGHRVAVLVDAMSEDPSISDYEARKAQLREQVLRAGEDAWLIYAADKVAKVRELRAQLARDPAHGPGVPEVGRRLGHYVESLRMLESTGSTVPIIAQLRFELELLSSLPPGSRAPELDELRWHLGGAPEGRE